MLVKLVVAKIAVTTIQTWNEHPKDHRGRFKLKEMGNCMLESIVYIAISFTYSSITMHLLKYKIIHQSIEQNHLAILVQKSMLIVQRIGKL